MLVLCWLVLVGLSSVSEQPTFAFASLRTIPERDGTIKGRLRLMPLDYLRTEDKIVGAWVHIFVASLLILSDLLLRTYCCEGNMCESANLRSRYMGYMM